MITEKSFSEMLKHLIQQRNITQTELAKYIGVKPNTISNYCNNISQPDIDTIIKIASYFDVSIDYLLTGRRTENKILREELGLSEKTLQTLKELTSKVYGEKFYGLSYYIDKLLSDDDFLETFFTAICDFETDASLFPMVKKAIEAKGKDANIESYMDFVEYQAAQRLFEFFKIFFERENIKRSA